MSSTLGDWLWVCGISFGVCGAAEAVLWLASKVAS